MIPASYSGWWLNQPIQKKYACKNWKSSPRCRVKRKNIRNHLVQYVYFNIDDLTVHNQSFILRYSCSKDPVSGSNQQKKSTLLGTNIYHICIYRYLMLEKGKSSSKVIFDGICHARRVFRWFANCALQLLVVK